MRVRALVSFAGPGFACNAGDVFELPAGRERWLAIGFVEPVTKAPETTAVKAPERAEMPRPKRKRAGSSK